MKKRHKNLNMFHLLLLLLWSSAVRPDADHDSDAVRLVGGASRCAGALEVRREAKWKRVDVDRWSMDTAAAFCEWLDCGSAVSVTKVTDDLVIPVMKVTPECLRSGSALKDCLLSRLSHHHVQLTCSDSVRLLNGSSQCSGRLQVRTDPSDRRWSSVCEADLDLQDAAVVCRELGCGAPSALQGALYGDLQTPPWTSEFQCGGQESALVDCRRSASARSSCSPGRAAGLTCSEPERPVRLVGGASHCDGTVEVYHLRTWRPVYSFLWNLQTAVVFCRLLDCGSPKSVENQDNLVEQPVWITDTGCVGSAAPFSDCITTGNFSGSLKLNCSDSVRLLNGSSQCSGRLQVKNDLLDRRWSSVCEADLDLQDAEVVCRELGCGAPSALQGALYGDLQTPPWSPKLECGGQESDLLDCRRSASARSSCSPGRAAGLTCSEPVRLVDGASRCAGTLQVKHLGEWRQAHVLVWNLQAAAVFCERLDCGAVVSVARILDSPADRGWLVRVDRLQAGDDLRDSVLPTSRRSFPNLTLICSELQQGAAAHQ